MSSYLFRVIVIPTSVFLSVLFGASYGSGREVVEFVSSNGPTGGLVALLTLVLTHAVLLVLSFELARLFKSYDYVSFFKILLKRGWVLYEIVILMGLVIALSIATSVGGTVLEDHFGMSAWIGSLMILGVVVSLNYFGRKIVEGSMMLSVSALFIVLTVLVVQLISGYSEQVAATFSEFGYQDGGVYKGLMYAIGGGGYIPLLLYCATGLKTRSEAFTAGIVAALVAGVPALVFHFAFMAGYPEIIEQRIPTYWMFNQISTPLMLNIYVAVMFVLISQTGVGVLQGLIQRLDVWHRQSKGKPLTSFGHAGVAAAAVIVSTALGSMGIVALILRGYTILFMSFIVVFVVPLLTYGLYLIFWRRNITSDSHLYS
ncbi:MAG: hypothetical protein AB8G18_07875 [Gammaproteobacteria bacterium]